MAGASADGHRKRLRTKFLSSGFTGFHDYEVIELLLTFGIPRKDCKPIAKDLMNRYKSVNAVLNANVSDLVRIKGLGESSVIGLKLARELAIYSGKESLLAKNHSRFDIDEIADQLIREIGHDKKETFKVICLNTKGSIIADTVSVGSLNASIAQPREVFQIAIENAAASIILAHNHPSGDTSPSDDDIFTTRKIVEAGKIIGIDVEDHVIVSSVGFTSLSRLGYI